MQTSPKLALAAALLSAPLCAQGFSAGAIEVDLNPVAAKDAPFRVRGNSESIRLEATAAGMRGEGKMFTASAMMGDDNGMVVTLTRGGAEVGKFMAESVEREAQGRRPAMRTWDFGPIAKIAGSTISMTGQAPMAGGQASLALSSDTVFMHGTTEIGGEPWHVAVVDFDWDGKFGGAGDFWAFASEEAATSSRRGFSEYNMIEGNEPVFVEDNSMTAKISIDGSNGTITIGKATEKLSDYLHRRNERVGAKWRKRFETELADLIAQRSEEGRTKTDKPIEWMHELDLEAAKKIAKRDGKLILADFETDWCIWCKVIDHITYPDAEVASYIREHFVPVKINAEFPIGTLNKDLGVRGYPGMPIVNGDGEKVGYIGGFSPPSAFLEKLKEAVANAGK